MLWQLVKINLFGYFNRLTKTSKRKQGVLAKSSVILILIVSYFALGYFIYMMFESMSDLVRYNLEWLYFTIMLVLMFTIAVIGTIFMTYNELYQSKDNSKLLVLPIKNSTVILSRVFSIILVTYIYSMIVTVPALIAYISAWGIGIAKLLIALFVILTSPLLSLTVTAILSYLIALIMSKIGRFKNLIMMILFIAGFGAYMYFVIMLQNEMNDMLLGGINFAKENAKLLFPFYAGAMAIAKLDLIYLLGYVAITFVPFAIIMAIISANFVKMATTKAKVRRIKFKMGKLKTHGVMTALIQKELRHYFSNAMVVLNSCMGSIFGIIAIGAMIYFNGEIREFISIIPKEYKEYLTPGIAIAVIYIVSFNYLSASAISLEGISLWIVKSLPVKVQTLYNAKLLAHLIVSLPIAVILALGAGVFASIGVFDVVMIIVASLFFILMIDCLGLLMNIIRPRFDWINETYCVKQSLPVFVTLFASMGIAVGLVLFYLFVLVDTLSVMTYFYLCVLAFALISTLLYWLIMSYGIKKFANM